jgi:[ribosomal protein S18]-alanine N-acetyltransferase
LIESDGFLIGRAVAGEAEILTLAVDPNARRRGTGGRLVQGFFTQAQNHNATTAFLEVAADNFAAIALYLRAGFAEVGRRRGYYEQAGYPAIDALVLSRPL